MSERFPVVVLFDARHTDFADIDRRVKEIKDQFAAVNCPVVVVKTNRNEVIWPPPHLPHTGERQ